MKALELFGKRGPVESAGGYKMTKLITTALAVILTTQAKALTQNEVDYYTIDSVTIQEIPDEAPLSDKIKTLQHQQPFGGALGSVGSQLSPLKELEVQIDTIINIGQKIWAIVEKGKPVVNVEVKSASAMPAGIKGWQQLTGWQMPRSSTYRVHYTNLFGMNVVDFSYRVMFTYGGSYNGKGHYVTGATILPAALDVAWGYSFKAGVEIPTVVNMGSSEDPVGGVQLNVNWVVGTVLKHSQTRASYFVDGLGRLQELD